MTNGFVGVPYTPGSETSTTIAEELRDIVKNKRELAWRFINRRGWYGATFDEFQRETGENHLSASRFTELVRLGRIRKSKRTRPTEAGNAATVHVAIPPEDWEDKRPNWPSPLRSTSPLAVARQELALALENLSIADGALRGIIDVGNLCLDMYGANGMKEIAQTALDRMKERSSANDKGRS